jgi:intracellular multiplication protein IcmV
MGFKKTIKRGVTSTFNVKRWLASDQIKQSGKTVKNLYNDLYGKKTKGKVFKSFEECVRHYGLTEDDIKKREKSCLLMSVTLAILAVPCFAYAIYLFATSFFLSGVVALSLSALLLAYAFRENFNYFQIKQRRLGCTWQEWFNATFKGKRG